MVTEKPLASLLPVRLPHWRLNRVTEILRRRPQPPRAGWRNDQPIRIYYRLLIELLAAGDDEVKLAAVREDFPAVYEAHRYHYSPDYQRRQEIEARLLTRESPEEIASRLGANPKAIDYYASLFFDVRDALDLHDWIVPMIRSRMRYDEDCGCSRAEVKRGYVMRLFAYCGGPLVLETLINPLSETKPPESAAAIRTWSEQAVTQIVRTLGTAAAATIDVTGKNGVQLIRLAQRRMGERNTELGPDDDVINKHIEAALAWFENSCLKTSIHA